MTANPVLAEATRADRIENIHRGGFCVAEASGRIVASAGDIERRIFPRSAVKAIQALAIFRSGAAEKFALDDKLLALACASHRGERAHVAGVERFLGVIGLSTDHLECGTHPPSDRAARNALREAGETPGPVHNNCSGKHAGMLAVAVALGAETKGYVAPGHSVQQLVRSCLEDVTGAALPSDSGGTDGCSIPTWPMPLSALATGFARMATGEGLAAEDAKAAKRLLDAATGHPFLVAGTGALDTDLMQAFGGRLMLKGGAEGVYCGAIRDKGIGFALKIDDGKMQAAETVAAALIEAIAGPGDAERAALAARTRVVLKNWRGIEVGALGATDAAKPAI